MRQSAQTLIEAGEQVKKRIFEQNSELKGLFVRTLESQKELREAVTERLEQDRELLESVVVEAKRQAARQTARKPQPPQRVAQPPRPVARTAERELAGAYAGLRKTFRRALGAHARRVGHFGTGDHAASAGPQGSLRQDGQRDGTPVGNDRHGTGDDRETEQKRLVGRRRAERKNCRGRRNLGQNDQRPDHNRTIAFRKPARAGGEESEKPPPTYAPSRTRSSMPSQKRRSDA